MRATRFGLLTAAALCALLAACSQTPSGNDAGGAATPPVVPPVTPPVDDGTDDPPAGGLHAESVQFTASDGEKLFAWVGGVNDIHPRPVILEFSPYAPACCGNWFGSGYNYVQVHARGTGLSTGTWGAVGPRDQQDLSEFLAWACTQPWSNGHIGLYGFSASAIEVYNSMHLPLACVDVAVLMAGSADLYRDLLYPGGIPNTAPAAEVGFAVGAPLLETSPQAQQMGETPFERLLSGAGLLQLYSDVITHQTEDQYWLDRTQRPGPNHFPVLADTSFYDPEPRGPFESFQMLRDAGTEVRLRVFGAHDGFPAKSPGAFPDYKRWFDRFLLGIDTGIESEPVVQMYVGNGSFEKMKAGDFARIDGSDWPLPGTRWQRLYLDGTRGNGAHSINDGALAGAAPAASSMQAYPDLVSMPTATDPDTTSVVNGAGAGALFDAFPFLTEMALMEPLSLSWTTPALNATAEVVGPASLDLFAATTLPGADLYAVLADVWPDNSAHAVGVGRLRTRFPDLVPGMSRVDGNGEIIQPYGDYSTAQVVTPGETREYHVEFWPVGNRFQAGHRVRLYLVGTSGYMTPMPGVNLISLGGDTPSRLLLPVLPGSDLCAAMGATGC